jgi:pimeloyl-ACP methyl ester carboxylesterase
MFRLAAAVAALACFFAGAAHADCAVGAYAGPTGQAVAITRPEGSPALRYTFLDGRRGSLADEGAPVRCEGEQIVVQAIGGPARAWPRIAFRLTPTRFRSGDITLNGLLIEPPEAMTPTGKPPLTVFVHGSEKTAAVGGYYPFLLAAQGVSAFVYDKRGTGGSQGAYTQNFAWLADDVVAASAEARRLAAGRYGRFGLFGGSQGGWVAPLAARRAGADFVAVGFGLVLSPLEEDSEQVFDELRRKGYGPDAIAKARQVTDATAEVMASHFTAGYDNLAQAKRRFAAEPWLGQIEGEFTGEVLRADEATLRATGRQTLDNLDILWRYDAEAALRALPMPQLWVMAGDDSAAPGGLSRERLAGLKRAGRPIEVYVFPHTDHGIYEYVQAPDGTRKITRMADGYLRLLGDWIKQDMHPPYGTSVRKDRPSGP